MSVEQYSVVSHDWVNLESIINDLTQRVVGQELHPTSEPTFGAGTITGNLTVGGDLDLTGSLTLDSLTALRLVATDASKALVSSDLVNWVAGTTDRITVTDDADGTITLDLGANTQTLLDSFNGIFLETIDFTVTEAAGTVTGSLEQDSGGDLTQRFSDGYTTLDCTSPQCTIDLTAFVGTDAVPKGVFVYILQSGKTTLVASNSDWPATEHIKIANLLLRSATTTGTDGALVNRNWNDHSQSSNSQGHITHIEERVRQEHAQYKSGVALTLKDAAGNALTTGNSSTAVELVTTVGTVYQLHKHTFPAVDMYTTATDDAHIANQPTDEGGAYETTVDLVTDITHYSDGSAAGVAIGVNKYFNLVVWGVQNRTGEASHLMVNIPTGQYTVSADAVSDIDGYSVYDIPESFKGTGFLIARLTFRLIAGSQWTYIAQEDLRGLTPSASAGVGVDTTDHALLANLTFAAAGHTGFLASDGSVALGGAWDMGSQILTNVNVDSGDINTAVTNSEWDTAYTHSQLASGNPHSVTPTELSLVIGTNTQAYDVGLTNLAGVAMAADKFYYTSADNVHVAADVTSFARTILDDVDEAAFKATVNLEIGTDVLAQQTIGIADDNLLEVDDADAADNDYAKFTANGLEGRSYSEVLTDLSGQASAAFNLNGQDLTNGGVLFLTEQAAAEADVAGKGQFWVKTSTPNLAYFVDDTGVEYPLGAAELSDRTINFTSGMSAATIQALIDGVARNVVNGVVITFQFGDGTYTLDNYLYFAGFYGGGEIRIYGNGGETNANALHTTQAVILDFTNNTHGIYATNITNTVSTSNIKVIVNSSADVRAFFYVNVFRGTFLGNYALGDSTSVGAGFQLQAGFFYLGANYVSNVLQGIRAIQCRMYSDGNDDTGTQPAYGLYCQTAGTIGKNGTQPAGSTANEGTAGGGVIR